MLFISFPVRLTVLAAATLVFLLTSCAGTGRPAPQAKRALPYEADSLFNAGKYDEAKIAYRNVITAAPSSNEAKNALYAVAYINVFHKNQRGDWNAALHDFDSFVKAYPDDRRTGEAFSWIRVLSIIKSVDSELRQATTKVERLRHDKNAVQENQRYYLDSISTLLHNANETRDSLVRKNSDLENTIIDLEKKCQQAGR